MGIRTQGVSVHQNKSFPRCDQRHDEGRTKRANYRACKHVEMMEPRDSAEEPSPPCNGIGKSKCCDYITSMMLGKIICSPGWNRIVVVMSAKPAILFDDWCRVLLDRPNIQRAFIHYTDGRCRACLIIVLFSLMTDMRQAISHDLDGLAVSDFLRQPNPGIDTPTSQLCFTHGFDDIKNH